MNFRPFNIQFKKMKCIWRIRTQDVHTKNRAQNSRLPLESLFWKSRDFCICISFRFRIFLQYQEKCPCFCQLSITLKNDQIYRSIASLSLLDSESIAIYNRGSGYIKGEQLLIYLLKIENLTWPFLMQNKNIWKNRFLVYFELDAMVNHHIHQETNIRVLGW